MLLRAVARYTSVGLGLNKIPTLRVCSHNSMTWVCDQATVCLLLDDANLTFFENLEQHSFRFIKNTESLTIPMKKNHGNVSIVGLVLSVICQVVMQMEVAARRIQG